MLEVKTNEKKFLLNKLTTNKLTKEHSSKGSYFGTTFTRKNNAAFEFRRVGEGPVFVEWEQSPGSQNWR